MLGIEHPIVQAPMGYIARAQLASAVSNAGGLGIIETSSGQLDEDEMFYLLARGIPAPVARQLLVGGFLNEVMERLPDRILVEKLEGLIATKFAQRAT